LGQGQYCIEKTFMGSSHIPSSLKMWPKYSTSKDENNILSISGIVGGPIWVERSIDTLYVRIPIFFVDQDIIEEY
jgi:hypothetical protein